MEKPDETLSDEEAARRRDEVIKRMIATPPEPRKAKPKGVKRHARAGVRTPQSD